MSDHVPAFTSKVGYYQQSMTFDYYYGPRRQSFGALSQKVTRSVTVAVSNRGPLVKSDGIGATNYHRKAARLISLAAPRVETDSHKYESTTSIGYRGITLYMNPHGSAYGSAATTVPQWMTDKVIQECISELNDVQALIMEDFAQAKSTVSTAASIYNAIAGMYLLMRRGKWRKVRRRLRALGHDPGRKAANAWLAFFYGIKPLIGTIEAVLSSYKPKVLTKKVKHRTSNPVDPAEFVDGSWRVTASGNAQQRAECGMTVAINCSADLAFYNSLGLRGQGDLDALILLWALTPYSFVVDWLIPVERWLSTRRWSSGIKYQTGYVTRVLSCKATVIEGNPMTGANDSGALPICRVESFQFTRSAYNSFTPPSGLTLDWSLSPTQLFNAAALKLQRS